LPAPPVTVWSLEDSLEKSEEIVIPFIGVIPCSCFGMIEGFTYGSIEAGSDPGEVRVNIREPSASGKGRTSMVMVSEMGTAFDCVCGSRHWEV